MTTEEPKKVKIIRRKKAIETKSQLKCSMSDCENDECNHYGNHDENSNCKKVCGVYKEVKCVNEELT